MEYVKEAKQGELLVYQEVLNPYAGMYNEKFSMLILPRSLDINEEKKLLTLPLYEGETFNNRWDESTGGADLDLDLSKEVAQMVAELSIINIKEVISNPRLLTVPKLVFNHAAALAESKDRLQKLLDAKHITQKENYMALQALAKQLDSPLILNNGDFYPRNFIRVNEKIVLIDWETWNENSPFHTFDHIENVAAVCYIHMWNNQPWQENFIAKLKNLVNINENNLQRAILMKSLVLADFWFKDDGNNELCQAQINLFRKALQFVS